MKFEWDETKNRTNIERHGIDFTTAIRIFDSPVLTWTDDRKDYGEIRQQSVGMIGNAAFLAVIHTDRAGTVRIISARPANRDERNRYEKAIHKAPKH